MDVQMADPLPLEERSQIEGFVKAPLIWLTAPLFKPLIEETGNLSGSSATFDLRPKGGGFGQIMNVVGGFRGEVSRRCRIRLAQGENRDDEALTAHRKDFANDKRLGKGRKTFREIGEGRTRHKE